MDHIGIEVHTEESQIRMLGEAGELRARRIRTTPEVSRAPRALPDRDVVRPLGRDLRSGRGERSRRSRGAVRRDRHILRASPTPHAGP